MKKIFSITAILCMVLMLAACGDDKPTPESLNGEWLIDVETTATKSAKNPESLEGIKKEIAGVSFKFDTKAKTVTFSSPNESDTVSYEVESQKENVFALKIKGDTITAVFGKNNGKDTLTLSHETNDDLIIVLNRK